MKKMIFGFAGFITIFIIPSIAVAEISMSSSTKAGLKVISDYAVAICGQSAEYGKSVSLETGLTITAGLNAMVKKLVDIGVEGAGKYGKSGYEGVLREDLAAILRDQMDCRERIQNKLIDKFEVQTASTPESTPSSGKPQTNWKPVVDVDNDSLGWRLEQDMDECGQYVARYSKTDIQYKHAYISCIKQRKHPVLSVAPYSDDPIGYTDDKDWEPIVDVYNDSNARSLKKDITECRQSLAHTTLNVEDKRAFVGCLIDFGHPVLN